MDDTFLMSSYNNRPAPMVQTTGVLRIEEGSLFTLSCGHSLTVWDGIPGPGLYQDVPCDRCRDSEPIRGGV